MELEDVFREHERAVFACFFRVVGDRHTAEELAQETFFDLRIDLERVFNTLEKPDRETLMLVDFLGFTPAEASALMSIEAHAFRTRLHRARKRLRTQLEVTIP